MSADAVVTFLFTDLVGSTTQWEAHPAAMSQALARHDAIVRAAVETNGGTVFATGGDAFCVSFPDPHAAVVAAVALQKGLGAEPWPEPVRMATRVGIHTGPAERRDGDWFGPSLNRVARLMASAHGGQVLLSETSTALLGTQLPLGTDLLDLGEHQLKDLARPERIHQVRIHGLPSVFPPLRTGQPAAGNLPTRRSVFIGRDSEVEAVVAALSDSRMVTLVGAGGSGKTRIAVESARIMAVDQPDGVWFVDLSTVDEPGRVAASVSAGVGLVEADGRGVTARLIGHLADRRTLVVIDNCEQVAPGVAGVVDEVLDACPGVRIVATSRRPLGVEGERVHSIGGLDDDEALELFLERARVGDPDFDPGPTERSTVSDLCRRLDGLPLAIELVAPHVRVFGVDHLAERVIGGLALPAPNQRKERHRTVAAAIAWSHDLLDPVQQAVFRRLAVFVGGFDLAAAEAVAGGVLGGPDVGLVLADLVDQSLVLSRSTPDGHRYDMLQTVRAFASGQLDACGEAEAIRDRHLEWFGTHTGLADDVADIVDTAATIDIENWRLALARAEGAGDGQRQARLALGLMLPLLYTGSIDEAVAAGAALDEVVAGGDMDARDTALMAQALLANILGDFARSVEVARSVADRTSDEVLRATGLILVAHTTSTHAPDLARTAIDELEELLGDSPELCFQRGMFLLQNRDYEAAVPLLLRSVGAETPADLDPGSPLVNDTLRYLDLAVGLHLVDDDAGGRRALRVLDRVADGHGPAFGYQPHLVRALLDGAAGSFDEAWAGVAAAVDAVSEWSPPMGAADCVIAAGAVALQAGHFEEAAELLVGATRLGARSGGMMALRRAYGDRLREAQAAAGVKRVDYDRSRTAEQLLTDLLPRLGVAIAA